MLPNELKGQIGRLLNVFATRKNIPGMMAEYERAFLTTPLPEFTRSVSNVIDTQQFFPSIAELRSASPKTRRAKSVEPMRAGCEHCSNGLVDLIVEKNGIEYERVAACTCERGMQRMTVKYGRHSMRSIADVDPSWQAGVRAGVREELATTTRELHGMGADEEGAPPF